MRNAVVEDSSKHSEKLTVHQRDQRVVCEKQQYITYASIKSCNFAVKNEIM